MNPIILGPTWQLRRVSQFNHGFYSRASADWLDQDLPAHWQEHPELAEHTGNVVYCLRFSHPDARSTPDRPRRRKWLRAAGIFYWSQLYFNGRAFPRHEGYFIPQE